MGTVYNRRYNDRFRSADLGLNSKLAEKFRTKRLWRRHSIGKQKGEEVGVRLAVKLVGESWPTKDESTGLWKEPQRRGVHRRIRESGDEARQI
jgi:hypothetical protein